MKPALFLVVFTALLGGWLIAREAHPAGRLATDLLILAFFVPTLWVSTRVNEKLWWKEPGKRALIGVGLLLGVFCITIAVVTFAPRPPASGFSDALDQGIFVAASSMLGGGAILSIMLVGSGCRQAFKRWRYYRRIAR